MVAADNADMVAVLALLWEDCYRSVAEAKSDLASPDDPTAGVLDTLLLSNDFVRCSSCTAPP